MPHREALHSGMRIIIMSRHEQRQKVARDFGATDIVSEAATTASRRSGK
jgi:hypothetical protein